MSKIVEKIIEDISHIMVMDAENKKRLHTAVRLCETKGRMSKHELLQMTEAGIPVAKIYATIMRKKVSELSLSDVDNITYGDLTCILGIFAQDLMQMNQLKRQGNG